MYDFSYSAAQRNDLRVLDTIPTTRQWPSIMTLSVVAPTLAIGGTFSIWHSNSPLKHLSYS